MNDVRPVVRTRLPTTPFFLAASRLAVVLASCAVGCSDGDDSTSITGVVTFDGQPLSTGQIRFVPADGQGATAGGGIVDGRYEVAMPAGRKKVEISAPKVIGRQQMYDAPNGPSVDVVDELLPSRYNASTELEATAEAGRTIEQNFALSSR